MELGGVHHVTAVTGDGPGNVAFYTQVLGMRLVKKTVNQDDVSAYHLFYGDELGRPGTELTFFDWPYLPRQVAGTGTIGRIALRVPGREALDWWTRRLGEHGVKRGEVIEEQGRARLAFEDPEEQQLELVDDGGAAGGGVPWKGSPVPSDVAIRGLHGVTLVLAELSSTERTLVDVLGFRRAARQPEDGRTLVFEAGPGGPGTEVRVDVRPSMAPGTVGSGGVHHVAFRTPDEEEQLAWRLRVAQGGLGVTPVIDRFYFRSIYFREPGGVLFEIATDGPGFATDEDPEHLGEGLALPPFLEPHRAQIEAGLRPLEPAPG